MTNRVWVLGAPDPEMAAIESLLRECGERVEYALDDRGERVTAATAYRCPLPDVPAGSTVYAVECLDKLPEGGVRIDHHRPGDPGYGRPPSEFFEASSIGQVCAVLGCAVLFAHHDDACRVLSEEEGAHGWHYAWSGLGQPLSATGEPFGPPVRPGANRWTTGKYGLWAGMPLPDCRDFSLDPGEAMLIAAADHCLGAAYRGACPGVNPDALMRWRVEQRAQFQGRDVGQILADVERARDAIRRAPTLVLDGVSPRRLREEGRPAEASRALCVRDMRGVCTAHRLDHDCGCATQQCVAVCGAYAHGPCSVPELPDAASRDGEAYLALVTVDGSGRPCRPKIVLGGCTTPEMVRAFLEYWAPRQGLVDCYGDPERGFAGGYLPCTNKLP